MLKVQEASSIFRVDFALSKLPHLHRAYLVTVLFDLILSVHSAYLVTVCNQIIIAVCKMKISKAFDEL